MSKLKVAVIGAGNRGSLFAELIRVDGIDLEVVAVAEPIYERRMSFAQKHHITNVFSTWEEMLREGVSCDVIIVTTQDRQHFLPTMAALDLGYHVLVEKPLSPDFNECMQMVQKAKKKNRLLMLCYVLRYTPFFQQIKKLITNKQIGDVKHIRIDMDVAYWHQAHSYVRGNWRNAAESSNMLLAKSCHDMDMFSFLLQKSPMTIASFGHLTHFKKEYAPAGAAQRCMDHCKVESECPFSAIKIYLGEHTDWPVSTISEDTSYESRKKAIETGPYGRCVYYCDNDVVDHQTVNLLYEDGTTASLTMSGFTERLTRKVRVLGTRGEIYGDMNANELYFRPFGEVNMKIDIANSSYGMHAGGDYGLLKSLIQHIYQYDQLDLNRYYHDLLQSHYLVDLAEKSRLTGQTLQIEPLQRATTLQV